MDAQALTAGAAPAPAPMETSQTEFEGHPITVHTAAVYTEGSGNTTGSSRTVTANVTWEVHGTVIQGPTVLGFNLPADLAEPWEFAARFLQHEWRTQRQNHPGTYPAEMLFGGIAACPQRRCARFFYEESPAHDGPPLLWTSRAGQTEFPVPSNADARSFTRAALKFKQDLFDKQGGPWVGTVAYYVTRRGMDMLMRTVDFLEDRGLGCQII